MSWRFCPLEDDVDLEPLLAQAETFPRPLVRSWQTWDLDEADDVPEVRGPRSRPVNRVNQKRTWCQLAVTDEDITDEVRGPRSRGLRSWCKPDLEDTREDARPARRRAWCQPDLHDHDVPAPPVKRSKEVSLQLSTMRFLSNLPTKKVLNKYDQNGMDPGRIRHVLQGSCKCKQRCIHQFT